LNGSRRWIAWLAVLVLGTMFARGTRHAMASGAERPPMAVLRVFAAASLVDAFQEIAHDFEVAHPGTRVQLNLAGSQQLATQIEQGASADVFTSADQRWMDYLKERSLLAGDPEVFAHNRLVVIVPRTNPARIARLQDLARPGVKLVLGAEAVPVGAYSREVIRRLAKSEGFVPAYATRVLANVVSEEENVKSVVGKVQLGEADAGLCYQSDVTPPVARFVRVLEIPDAANVLATYPIAVVANAPAGERARAFVSYVRSPEGQRALERHRLIPVAAETP
jgi:molybdate transport system substrate-binding protein